jgi:hypothetical protein
VANGKPAIQYVLAHGKRIAVETLNCSSKDRARPKRAPFKVHFVKLPSYWIEQLQCARLSATFKLALHILREDYKQKHTGGGEIVLSNATTGLTRNPRRHAIQEMIDLKLIQIKQVGKQAPRVTCLLLDRPKPKRTNGG